MTTMFVDASALTSIAVGESDADDLAARLQGAERRLISPIALWETAAAVARIKQVGTNESWAEVERFVTSLALQVGVVTARDAEMALRAHGTYGKRSGHRANLNMGDCFAYACAKANGAHLLYKGDDFGHTDLA